MLQGVGRPRYGLATLGRAAEAWDRDVILLPASAKIVMSETASQGCRGRSSHARSIWTAIRVRNGKLGFMASRPPVNTEAIRDLGRAGVTGSMTHAGGTTPVEPVPVAARSSVIPSTSTCEQPRCRARIDAQRFHKTRFCDIINASRWPGTVKTATSTGLQSHVVPAALRAVRDTSVRKRTGERQGVASDAALKFMTAVVTMVAEVGIRGFRLASSDFMGT